MALNREINYLNKDFDGFRADLINYAQTYFPTTYTDFDPSSPGVMFMEMASYVGDVLSFYLDSQIQENFLQYTKQTNNIYDLAYMFNYKPKTTGLSTVELDFFQEVPAKEVNGKIVPDFDYALYIGANTQISSNNATVNFTIEDPIDFSVSNPLDPTTVTISQISNDQPTYYLLKKKRNAVSGTINSTTFSFGAPEEFSTVNIGGANIAGIIDCIDSDGNEWYEVDHLAQDMVFDGIKNTNVNDPNNYQNSDDTPYVLKNKQVQRRFTTRFLNQSTLQLQFGSGNPSVSDEEVIPNPFNVGIGLPFEKNKLTTAYSPTNFIFTNTYGIAPSNTTLTLRYYSGGGVESNIPANSITGINTSNVRFNKSGLNSTTANYIFGTIATNNENPASGGQDGDTVEEIRQNTISQYSSQLRNVTANDYLVRALSMPSRYGVISKGHVQKPKANENLTSLDLYVLSQNQNGSLKIASSSLKKNLKTYLNQYRMIGDTLAIKDAFVINIACDFEIITLPNYNNNEVLINCINTLRSYFNTNNWQINQPIILRDLFVALDAVKGIQTVKKVIITNKRGTTSGYSQYAYDVEGATQNGVIYPSLDPSIFELKYPNQDIKGKVVTL
jgi:hypothetical protein